MKIAYWAMFHGQTKSTTNMLLIHIYAALKSDVKQLIISNQFSYNLIEEYLGIEKDKNTSLDNLLTALRNKTLRHDYFLDYTESLMKNQALDIITESIHSHRTVPKNIEELFVGVTEIADKIYKNVVTDVNAGLTDFNKCILDSSDLIIVNLNQNKYAVKETIKEIRRLNYESKVKYIVGDYIEATRLTKRNMERTYKIAIEGVIPHNKNIMNATNSGNLLDFVNQNLDVQEHDENYYLFSQLNNISKHFR